MVVIVNSTKLDKSSYSLFIVKFHSSDEMNVTTLSCVCVSVRQPDVYRRDGLTCISKTLSQGEQVKIERILISPSCVSRFRSPAVPFVIAPIHTTRNEHCLNNNFV